jgi:hypothetical protein
LNQDIFCIPYREQAVPPCTQCCILKWGWTSINWIVNKAKDIHQ